jgi:biotin operon repressor
MNGTQPQITDKQTAIKERLDRGMSVRTIANEIGITRGAVYQQIKRLRKQGVFDADYTPTGQELPAGLSAVGEATLRRLLLNSDGDVVAAIDAAGALVAEIERTRNELVVIARRLSTLLQP